jgi:alkylation response protein AidB-like acyl-CoA dehydrogenase
VWLVQELGDGTLLLEAEGAALFRRLAWLLSSALLTGNAAAALDVAVQYAKDRAQFGRAIGSFQAVKHMVADMHAATELARVATQAAGVLVDDAPDAEADRAVASARRCRAARSTTATCIRFTGMGFVGSRPAPHQARYIEALRLDRAPRVVADLLTTRTA